MLRYIMNLLVSFDCFINCIIAGSPYETISSRTYRARESKSPRWFVIPLAKFINSLFFWQADHLEEAYEEEVEPIYELYSWIKEK